MFDSKWLEHHGLKNMDPRKKQAILQLMKETDGKPMNQCIPTLMKTNQNLKSQGLTFTKSETATLIELMSANMTPQEQQQATILMQMMNRMK